MKMARARYQRKINKELEKLPEFKQPFAKKALYKVLEKFYGETEERINTSNFCNGFCNGKRPLLGYRPKYRRNKNMEILKNLQMHFPSLVF